MIDDDEDLLVIVKYSLEHLDGVTIVCVTSGKAGVQEASTFLPDLILLDIMMPDMDGLETLQQIRLIPQMIHTPVIILTAKILDSERSFYASLNGCNVISKPFDPQNLSTGIQIIWDRYQERGTS